MTTSTGPEVLLVDGHSIIFADDALRRCHTENGAEARRRLVRLLLRFQDNSGCHVVVVFDGRGPRAAADPEENRLQVFYSKSGQTADSVIERLVAKYAATHRITVATDDHLERTTVTTFGASWISSRGLIDKIEAAEQELAGALQTLKRRNRQ
jgi:predicted RNA-binding protein with PIN domain